MRHARCYQALIKMLPVCHPYLVTTNGPPHKGYDRIQKKKPNEQNCGERQKRGYASRVFAGHKRNRRKSKSEKCAANVTHEYARRLPIMNQEAHTREAQYPAEQINSVDA